MCVMVAYNGIILAALIAASAHWGITKAPVFQHAYITQLFKQADNAWLYSQCQQPDCFSHMRHHATVCQEVQAEFAISPLMAGLQACFPNAQHAMSTWNKVLIGILFGMCIMMAPTLLLPAWQRRNHRLQIARLHKSNNDYTVEQTV